MVEFPAPTSAKELRRFLGMASYYRRFVRGFAEAAAPLTALLKKGTGWRWGRAEQDAFRLLLGRLADAPVLAHLDESGGVTLHTDASLAGLGAVLSQGGGPETERVVCFASRTLTDAESRWAPNDLECLAVVWAVGKLRVYLYGRKVIVRTDSRVARALLERKNLEGKHARWAEKMADLSAEITFEYCPGAANLVADALSRAPLPSTRSTPPDAPCDGAGVKSGAVVAMVRPAQSGLAFRTEEIAIRQFGDGELRRVIESIRGVDGVESSDWPGFRLVSGVLYKKGGRGARQWLLAIPRSLRLDVVRGCHEDPSSGHEGQEKTLARVSARFWWPGMGRYIRHFVRSCAYCQARKIPRQLPSGPMEPIPVPAEPFKCWGVDHLGPLPLTVRGNAYILAACDYFTKNVVAMAVENTKAEPAIRFLLDGIVYRYGVPAKVITDQGKAFISRKWIEVIRRLGIDHSYAAAEHQQSNGLVEKTNGVVIDRMAAHIEEVPTEWDLHLSSAVFSIITSKHSSTSFSPFQIMFGALPVLPVEGRYPWPAEVDEAVRSADSLVRIRQECIRKIQAAQIRQKKYYDARRRPSQEFLVGDLVVVRRQVRKKGIPKKFQPRFVGPFEVIRRLSPTTYQVGDLECNRTAGRWWVFPAHTSQLKKWHLPLAAGDEMPDGPDDDAADDAADDDDRSSDNGSHRDIEDSWPMASDDGQAGLRHFEVGAGQPEETDDDGPSGSSLLEEGGQTEDPTGVTAAGQTPIATSAPKTKRGRLGRIIKVPSCFKNFVMFSP